MTPKEKAIELSNKYFEQFLAFGEYLSIEKANKCALIAVDEIINANGLHPNDTDYDYNKAEIYWQEVKQEIEKL
jgi:hypothetical protein